MPFFGTRNQHTLSVGKPRTPPPVPDTVLRKSLRLAHAGRQEHEPRFAEWTKNRERPSPVGESASARPSPSWTAGEPSVLPREDLVACLAPRLPSVVLKKDRPHQNTMRFLRGDRRRGDAIHCDLARHFRLDHAYHHRCHRRRRCGAAGSGGALERGEFDRLLGDYDSRLGRRRGAGVLGGIVGAINGLRQTVAFLSEVNTGSRKEENAQNAIGWSLSSDSIRIRGSEEFWRAIPIWIGPIRLDPARFPCQTLSPMHDVTAATESLKQQIAARHRGGAAADLCDHLAPGRRQDHADRETAAVRRRHQSRRARSRPRASAATPAPTG